MDADKVMMGPNVTAPSGSGRRFTPTIYWKANGEAKYIAFMMPAEQMPLVLLHTFVDTPNGLRTFVCRKYPPFVEESGGECLLCDHLNHKPTWRRMAVAFELDPQEEVKAGRKKLTGLSVQLNEVEQEDGTSKFYPRVGIILQADKNFFRQLFDYDTDVRPLDEVAFKIIKNGERQNVSFSSIPLDIERPDVSEYEEFIPDLIDWIAEHGSEVRYAEELAGAEPVKAAQEAAPVEDSPSIAELKARLAGKTS